LNRARSAFCTVAAKRAPPLFFPALFAILLAARLCHLDILWAEETLPLAAASQMRLGKTLYQGVWFDKPPMLAWTYLLWGARDGAPLRLAGAVYALFVCWVAWRFASDLWGRREALWAAGLLAFYLIFDLPAAVTPLASDLLMLAPHLGALWLAWRRRAFWSGVLAGLAFLTNPKGIFVLAACTIWNVRALPLLVAGFALPQVFAAAWLWSQGALGDYYEQVWKWGRIYARDTFLANAWADGLRRTAHWLGFHAAIVLPAFWFWGRDPKANRAHWAAWAGISWLGVDAGWRFFPRYYFQLLPIVLLAGARGLAMLSSKRAAAVAALLLIPLLRFGPRYALLASDLAEGRQPAWVDLAMDRDSRVAARIVRQLSAPGDTLFVWGFRPELYVYTRMPAATRYLDSQPLTGVPADRHLTLSQPVEVDAARARRAALTRTDPTFIVDGLGPINSRLGIVAYEDLRAWFADYGLVAATGLSRIYQRRQLPAAGSESGPAPKGNPAARHPRVLCCPSRRPAFRQEEGDVRLYGLAKY
jgi:hypothetical protein